MLFPIICAFIVISIGFAIYRIKSRSKPLDFKGKRVFITGGSSGIGEAMAYMYSELGAIVIIASNQRADVPQFSL